MKSPSEFRGRVRPYRGRLDSRPMNDTWLLVGCFICFTSSAMATPEPSRFQLVGSGTLRLDQPEQKSGNVQLMAHLTLSDPVSAASPLLQRGGGFALMATLDAASLVCYNDTIFRDDFDGDGF